ncbi:deoxyribodipyrimidine photo-lyase [Nitrincola sp. A-D6]|uniref:deoxyribodipyrimidine photo-lyase n=1 Tax=Nitrincola sp. A-D6 TaxID=1545442 RepID=UPI0006902402|nr:deoxyribodipyrimidine photo-lyase [Nitrincola sp. A-D6]
MKLVWLRNDLRRLDNPALFYACEMRQGVTAVVTLTPLQWQLHSEGPARMALWRDQLRALQSDLAELNIGLRVLQLKHFDEVPGALQQLAAELQVDSLYFNYEYPLNERQRDRQVCTELETAGVRCLGYHGELVIAPGRW